MSDSTIEQVPFWGTDPNILFKHFDFFPVKSMTYEEKLNAITRGVAVLGAVSFVLTLSLRIIVITFITILAIFAVYNYGDREGMKDLTGKDEEFVEDNPISSKFLGAIGNQDASGDSGTKYKKLEGTPTPVVFQKQNPADIVLQDRNIAKGGVFGEPVSSNPFGNFLVSDYVNNPHKKPAPPAFNVDVNQRILTEAKKLVADLNPGQPDISDKLFKDLGEQYVFEQSLRQFTSNPSTTLVNDQTGFADFCYGSMTSCKEGNLFACARNLPRHVS
jgi:hypothetical protein